MDEIFSISPTGEEQCDFKNDLENDFDSDEEEEDTDLIIDTTAMIRGDDIQSIINDTKQYGNNSSMFRNKMNRLGFTNYSTTKKQTSTVVDKRPFPNVEPIKAPLTIE